VVSTHPQSSPVTSELWQWRGHAIRYTAVGSGQPLVLIHGFGASIGHWRHNIPVLAAAGYRVFALDLLGFGGSAKPALDYSMELWQNLVRDFWMAHIRQPAIWIGNSIGGLLSLMMAANHPDLTRGLIVLNCAGGISHRPQELALPARLVMSVFTTLLKSEGIGTWMFDRIRDKSRIKSTLRQVYFRAEAITDELVDLLHAPSCDPGAQKVFASIVTAAPGPSPAELMPKVQCPILVVWGEADPWTPLKGANVFQDHSDRLSIQFSPIPDTGHCPHDERPEIVNPLILDWLAVHHFDQQYVSLE
jgi:pimeloyl-ACP methyl ester carboxylesterase